MKKDYNNGPNEPGKENDPEKQIFKTALGSLTIEPSEKFWNSALHNIINKGDEEAKARAKTWKYISFGMGGIIVLFCLHDALMYNKIDKVEQQNTEITNLQKKLLEAESKQANTTATNNAAPVVTAKATEPNVAQASSNQPLVNEAIKAPVNNTVANAASNKANAWHNTSNKGNVPNAYALHQNVVPNTASSSRASANSNTYPAVNKNQAEANTVPTAVVETNSAAASNNKASAQVTESNMGSPIVHNTEVQEIQTANAEPVTEKQTEVKQASADSLAKANRAIDSVYNIDAAEAQVTKKAFSLKHRLSVAAYFAPGSLNDFLRDKDNDGEDKITPSMIKARQTDWLAYEAGFNIGFDISKKLTVRTGLYYNAYSYNIKETVITAQNQENGQLGYSIATSSGLVNIPYTASIKPGDSIKVHGSSSRGYVCIPLQLNYMFFNRPKFGLYADIGLAANIAASTSTQISWQNTSLQEGSVGISSIEGLQQINYSYHLGVGATYKVYRGFSLFLEPFVQGAVTPISRHTPIETYPMFLGCSLGVGFHF